MKNKLLYIVVFFIFLIIPIAYAQECALAIPRYGVLQCVNTSEQEDKDAYLGTEYLTWSTNTIKCLSHCEINEGEDIRVRCKSSHYPEYEIQKNKKVVDSFPITWNHEDSLLIKARCYKNNQTYDLLDNSRVEYEQDKIIIYRGWNDTNLEYPIEGTEDCELNTFNDVKLDFYLDPITGDFRSKPESTYERLGAFPNNWEIGDYYSFINAWQNIIPDVLDTYDKTGNRFWCGINNKSGIIYAIKTVEDPNGKCYDVPQAILKSNANCCFESDCEYLGELYTCNPETWSCEKTMKCDSDRQCKDKFTEDTCEDDQFVRWFCNYYKPWGEYKGSCEKEVIEVKDCPEECEHGYNYEEWECKELNKENDILIQGYAVSNSPVLIELSSIQKVILLLLSVVIIIELVYYFKK